MDDGLKKRLIGATVLVSLVVIFVPMLLQNEPVIDQGIRESNIPLPPKTDFSSRVIPDKMEPPPLPKPAVTIEPEPATVVDDKPAPQPPEPEKIEPPKVETREGLSAWVIQVGSFSQRDNADNLLQQLRAKEFAADIEQISIKGSTLFRVLIGPEVDRGKAEKLLERVNKEVKPLNIQGTLRSYP